MRWRPVADGLTKDQRSILTTELLFWILIRTRQNGYMFFEYQDRHAIFRIKVEILLCFLKWLIFKFMNGSTARPIYVA